jgi:hypothetical protein
MAMSTITLPGRIRATILPLPIRVIREIRGEAGLKRYGKAVRNESGVRDGRPYLRLSDRVA